MISVDQHLATQQIVPLDLSGENDCCQFQIMRRVILLMRLELFGHICYHMSMLN